MNTFFQDAGVPLDKIRIKKKKKKSQTSLTLPSAASFLFCPIFCGDQLTPCPSKSKLFIINHRTPQMFIYS